MPKRATLTYTSEDAPCLPSDQLHVYYCKYSGKHAFTTDCDIESLPRRRADKSIVIDTRIHLLKLYTSPGEVTYLKRKNGKIECQYRYNVGILPVIYKYRTDDPIVFVLHNSVASYTNQITEKPIDIPVPPCIVEKDGSLCQVTLAVEDKASKPDVIKITADCVRIAIANTISHDNANEEILEFMSKILGCRLTQLSLTRSTSSRFKYLLARDLKIEKAYERLLSVAKKGHFF